jgi:6-phosphogluconate dehydrogenase
MQRRDEQEGMNMRMAMIGLGRMGANMARRLRRGGIEVVGYNRNQEVVQELTREAGLLPAASLAEVVAQLPAPRVLWLMLPAGEVTERHLQDLIPLLDAGDLVIDGGNAQYHDSQRRGTLLDRHDLLFMDAGTSGGVWGLDNGYCLMVGGSDQALCLVQPALEVLAPAPDRGWAHVGPVGAGHFTKMIHNGIEYGMMQALAEGLALLKGKEAFDLDLARITELWRHGSVVRSWLLDLTAEALGEDQGLADIAPVVADSGEGRWTVLEAIEQGIPVPVISQALASRFDSQGKADYSNRLLAVMRRAFGGHAVGKD